MPTWPAGAPRVRRRGRPAFDSPNRAVRVRECQRPHPASDCSTGIGPKLLGVSEKLSSLREQVYSDPRPEEYFDHFHERARRRGPTLVYEFVRVVTSLYAYIVLRARSTNAQRVPERGPVILAPNHFSYMDHFLVGIFIRRKVRFMAKSQLFKPGSQWIYKQGGVFPVRRGARDEEAFITAETILAGGGAVAMYPEGGRSRTGDLADRVRPGIGRLVLDSGAPVVPIAIHGSAKISFATSCWRSRGAPGSTSKCIGSPK